MISISCYGISKFSFKNKIISNLKKMVLLIAFTYIILH